MEETLKRCDLNRVKRLVLEDASVINASFEVDEQRFTPLRFAAHEGQTEVVKWLLDHGAQVDLQVGGGWTALMSASAKGHLDIVRLLIQHGANLELHTNGNTAFILACEEDQDEIAQVLLENGAVKRVGLLYFDDD